MLQVYDLQVEYLTNPLGVDATHPRFSWKLKSDRQAVRQTSWRIQAYSGDRLIWDSGTVPDSESQRIRYEGTALESRQQVNWKVTVSAVDGDGVVEVAESAQEHFEMGLLRQDDWVAKWIEAEGDIDKDAHKSAPYLRREFFVRPGLKQARIYQSAHGLYEFWINGQAGTEDKFKPGLTSYYKRIQYQVHDITQLLVEGVNAWSVMLGDGWWRGNPLINNFGYKLHFLGQIELLYEDGSRETVATGKQFKHATGGLLASDMKMGEIFDCQKEPQGWKLAGFNDSQWAYVHLTEEHADAQLIASRSMPARENERFEAKPFRDADGNLVLDFGQNIAGYVHMKLRGCQSGQVVHLLHGEDIKEGRFSIENIHPAVTPPIPFQEVIYTCCGKALEEFCPQFAIFGFRYVLLEGYAGEILPGDFTAVAVYSAMDETGFFTCSNPLINQLVRNSMWSMKGNFLDVATDCPTRERNAWTGDCQVFVRTATDFMNVYPFFEKSLQDMALEQYPSGKIGLTFPSTSSYHNPEELERQKAANPMWALAGPIGNGNFAEDSVGWGDAAVWIPYMLYLCYGDEQILLNQYDTARKWVDHMLRCAKEHNPVYEEEPQYHTYEDGELDADYIYDTRFHFGEWLEPITDNPVTGAETLADAFARALKYGKPKVATAYICRSAENLAHMAQILGYAEDHAKYSKIVHKIHRVYDKYLIAEDGSIEVGHQAAYVRALAMNLCSGEKRPKVVAQLVREIENYQYRLNTGFLSTPFLLHVLVDEGYLEIAFRILEQTECPSWLHPVLLGSTTILEGWDGMDRHAGSFNHYSYGAVCDFLFSRVAGIQPLFDKPGYREFILKPVVGGSLRYAEARYESIYGTIISRWEKTETGLRFSCTIPVNTTAALTLPDGESHQLGSGEYIFDLRRNKA